MRVVLDSNVWIDWLVFDDPGAQGIRSAQREGRLTIAIDAPCFDELKTVLAYPEFELDPARQFALAGEVLRCTVPHDYSGRDVPASLPSCTDPDDQKFIMLAHASAAQWLLTRDKALLKMSPRLGRAGIRVGTPSGWLAANEICV